MAEAETKLIQAAAAALSVGSEFPFDAPDSWWDSDSEAPVAMDWAHSAARGIMTELKSRRGVVRHIEGIDEAIRKEVVDVCAEIIRTAFAASQETTEAAET